MRRLAKAAITFTVLFSDLLLPPGLAALAQATTQSTTNTAAAAYNCSDNLVLQIVSTAQNDGVRIIVIEGTTQQDNSREPISTGVCQPSANDHENHSINTVATTTPGGSTLTETLTADLAH